VQGNNNIAQRNIQIENAGDAGSDLFVGMIAGTRDAVGMATLLLDASALRGGAVIRLTVPDEAILKKLWQATVRATKEQLPPSTPDQPEADCAVIIDQRTRLRVECGRCEIVIEAAPGSRIFTGCKPAETQLSAKLVKHQDIDAIEIAGLRGRLEIPLRLAGGQFLPLLVAVAGGAEGDLTITQRRGDGELSAGYGIRRLGA
jgi:hypothetical protein